jgi:uncharacterized protein
MSAGASLPSFAAWQHREARDGFEVVFIAAAGPRFEGHTVAVEDGQPFSVGYTIDLDDRHRTRSARVWSESANHRRTVALDADGAGRWTVDGVAAPHLDGCLDVDLESSALTNAFPMQRLALAPGAAADAPAAYVRALDLAVERLEQRYVRVDNGAGDRRRYAYTAPAFDFRCEIAYDAAGLVLDYPGIAVRAT